MRSIGFLVSFALCLAVPGLSFAQDSDLDEIVRLPGQGQGIVKAKDLNAPYRGAHPSRFVPGGGLMMSFDVNADGRVSPQELKEGAIAAFAAADSNEDGALTALEQQAWAKELPTIDDSLANPVRFDPNLDRMVSENEFTGVIAQMAVAYAEAGSGDIMLASLEAKSPEPKRGRDRNLQNMIERDRQERQRRRPYTASLTD